MARGAAGASFGDDLRQLLGPLGCVRLHRLLLTRATDWARQLASGRVHVALTTPAQTGELADALGEANVFEQHGAGHGQRLARASERAFERSGGPLLVIGTSVAALGGHHARAALNDLAAGCDASLGPTTAGRCYLLALAAPQPSLADLDAPDRQEQPLLARALASAAGLQLGLLRTERELVSAADARALAADPLTPGDVREVLRSCVDPR